MTVPEALSILELKVPLSETGIKKAFRNKARLFHPDNYTDPTLQQEASARFIRAKNACDLLLKLGPENINSGRHRHATAKQPRRSRQPVYRKPSPVIQHPIVKEIDRLVRLFHLVNRQGKKTRLWKIISGIRFVPSEWLGSWYIRLIEKKYPGEEKMAGLLFFFFRFFRLLFGSVALICGFFIMAVLALSMMVVFAPPLLLFLAIYHLYAKLVVLLRKFIKTKGKFLPGFKNSDLAYLMIRTLPIVPWLAFAELFFIFGLQRSYYVQSITWIFSTLLLLLLLSIFSEWLSFFRGKALSK